MPSKPAPKFRALAAAWLFAICLACSCAYASNLTQVENAKAGTSDWHITNPADAREIEGYASLTSINRGQSIDFFISTASPSYTIEVFRLGWYDGFGGRRMTQPVTLSGTLQTTPTPDPITGLVECDWTLSYTLSVPANPNDATDWPSGVYVAKLTELNGGKQRYILFVVRDDSRASDYVFQVAVNTYNAYNPWGGKSLYSFNSTGGAAVAVSFNRPYGAIYGDDGSGNFVEGWEYNMVRFLEREGYDLSFVTDVDVHSTPNILLNHHAHLIVGHNEYWSWEMRQAETAARDHNIGIGVFGADTSFWQVRFQPSNAHGQANRTMVSYKNSALTADPFYLDADHSNDYLVTTHWSDPPVSMPGEALFGVGFAGEQISGDIVVTNPTHWVFANTGLTAGYHLAGLLGYEVDS